jgi:hypothetical protein
MIKNEIKETCTQIQNKSHYGSQYAAREINK